LVQDIQEEKYESVFGFFLNLLVGVALRGVGRVTGAAVGFPSVFQP
jgi:hypothetical protein